MLSTRFIRGLYRDGTFVETSNIAEALASKPEIADTLIFAFGNQPQYGGLGDAYSVMQYLVQGTSSIARQDKSYRVIGNDEIQWAVMGHLQRSIPIAVDHPLATSTDARIGINFSTFKVLFPIKYFSVGFICRFWNGELARVVSEPYREGQHWCYEFQILSNNPMSYMNPESLRAGREVTWDFSAYEEGSTGGGMVDATPSWFRNQMTTTRISYGMTGSAKYETLWFEITNTVTGEKANLWMFYQQYLAMKQWSRQQERMIWNSRYNRLADGTFGIQGITGRPVKTGSGIEEQISGVNRIIASELTEDMLWAMTADMYQVLGKENSKMVLITGMGGIHEFHRILKKTQQQYQVVDTIFTNRETGNKLSFGGQFITYKGFMGNEITVVNHPMFNDRSVYPKTVGPYGYTDQSYKMFFIDFGDYDGEPNVQMITKGANGEDRRLVQWFTAGSTLPDFNGRSNVGEFQKALRSHGADSFTCYTLSETGIIIRNPLSCGLIEIRPE
jgi:hypothetical protein